MKKALTLALATLITTVTHASSVGTCANIYELMKDKRTAGKVIGEVTMAAGAVTTLPIVASAGGTLVVTAATFTAYPLLLPALGALAVGTSVYIGSQEIHREKIENAQELIAGAYARNKHLVKATEKINTVLASLGKQEIPEQEVARIIREKNENGTLCPLKKIKKRSGAMTYETYTRREIQNIVIGEII